MISPVWGDRFVRSLDPTFERKEIRRLEVITGVGGRRAWSDEDKGRIVAESFAVGVNVSAVARRYGLRPQQVYAWRRLARNGARALPSEAALGFVAGYRRRERTGAIAGDAVGHRRDRNQRHRDPRRARRGLAASARRAAGGEGGAVIPVPPGVRVLIATRPVDFRKGADSLAALAKEKLGQDPFSGAVLVFRSRRADRVKILVREGSGLALVWKRLQQ